IRNPPPSDGRSSQVSITSAYWPPTTWVTGSEIVHHSLPSGIPTVPTWRCSATTVRSPPAHGVQHAGTVPENAAGTASRQPSRSARSPPARTTIIASPNFCTVASTPSAPEQSAADVGGIVVDGAVVVDTAGGAVSGVPNWARPSSTLL